MNVKQQAAELLEQAAEILEYNGWCTNALEENGRYCAIGALQIASAECLMPGWSVESDIWRKEPEVALALQTLATAAGDSTARAEYHWESIVNWNNSRESANEVIDGMKRAAKELANDA